MRTVARWAAPESPIWLLDRERMSKARFSRRPWEKERVNTSAAIRGSWRWDTGGPGLYLSDVCSACVANRIEAQVERQESPVGRLGCWESRADETGALVSNPVVSQGQMSEAEPETHMTWIRHASYLWRETFWCFNASQSVCGRALLRLWSASQLTCCFHKEDGSSFALEERCPPMSVN